MSDQNTLGWIYYQTEYLVWYPDGYDYKRLRGKIFGLLYVEKLLTHLYIKLHCTFVHLVHFFCHLKTSGNIFCMIGVVFEYLANKYLTFAELYLFSTYKFLISDDHNMSLSIILYPISRLQNDGQTAKKHTWGPVKVPIRVDKTLPISIYVVVVWEGYSPEKKIEK